MPEGHIQAEVPIKVEKLINHSKHLEDDLQKRALKIEHHEENMRSLKSQINKIDEFINDMQDFNAQLENDASETSSKIENIKDNAIDRLHPSEGMEFNTVEEAQIFYSTYAKITGFGITTINSKFRDGKCLFKLLACRRYGEPRRVPTAPVHRYSPKVGCIASVKVKLDKVSGKWRLHNVVIEHNHYLSPLAVSCLSSCKRVCTSKEAKVRNMHSVGISTSNIAIEYKILSSQLKSDAQKTPTEIGNLKGNATDVLQPSKGMEYLSSLAVSCLSSCKRVCTSKEAKVRNMHSVGISTSNIAIEYKILSSQLKSDAQKTPTEIGNLKGNATDVLQPSKGMEFDTVEQVQIFYNTYAKSTGFGITTVTSKSRDGKCLYKHFACWKYGAPRRVPTRRARRPSAKVGCTASIKVKFDAASGKWTLSDAIIEHNHELNPLACVYLRSHQRTCTSEKAEVKSIDAEGISTSNIVSCIPKRKTGVRQLQFTDKGSRSLFNGEHRTSLEEVTLGNFHLSRLTEEDAWRVTCRQAEEHTIEHILRQDKTAAATACSMTNCHALQATKLPLIKDVLGVVATLGKVNDENISRLLSEYVGLELMLAIVCKNYESVKAVEEYDRNGLIDKNAGLHGLGPSIGRLLDGRFLVICLDNLRAYTGEFVADDPQRRLALLKPKLSSGECPPGFLGYAVNMISVDMKYVSCITSKGHGLRETLFYSLFSHLQVYRSREQMRLAIPFITDGAISLDGGIIKGVGMFSLGERDVEVRFPVCSGLSNVPLNIEEKLKIMKWEKEMHAEDMQREEVLFKHAKDLFNAKKQELLQHLREAAQYVNQVQAQIDQNGSLN